MPSYSCENCAERMTLKKASGKKKKCPSCGSMMDKDSMMGGIDPSAFGF